MGFCLTDDVGSNEPTCWVCGCHYTLAFEPARSRQSWGDRSSLSAVIYDMEPDDDDDGTSVYTVALPEPIPAF